MKYGCDWERVKSSTANLTRLTFSTDISRYCPSVMRRENNERMHKPKNFKITSQCKERYCSVTQTGTKGSINLPRGLARNSFFF